MVRTGRLPLLLLGGLLGLGGCTSAAIPSQNGGSTPVPASSNAPAGPTPDWSIGVPGGDASTTAPRSCFDRVLGARTVHLRGSRGSVHWDLAVPEFAGAPSAAEVNRHVRAAAQDAIELGVREGRGDERARRDVSGTATVTTSDRRTVQVELTWTDSLAGTAHPSDHVATTVVTTDAGRPVRLGEVLADEPGALRAIARAIRPLADPTDESGLDPDEKNFAAWQTTRDGMRFGFQDYQLGGHGLRSYTVPWRTVRPLLSDYGTGLLDPDVDPTTC